MNKQSNNTLFGLIGNLLVFAMIFYLYTKEGHMTPVYIALLVVNAIIIVVNLVGFFANRK